MRTYEQWKQEVDQWVERKIGLSADDLPDWNYRDAYDDGVRPSLAAAQAIRAAREY